LKQKSRESSKNASTKKKAERELQEATKRAAQEKIDAEENAKKEVEKAAALEKKNKDLSIKGALKELEALCKEKMPESKKFDRFWVDGTIKRTFKQK